MNRLDPKDFGLKLYNKFPESYRADDAGQKYALKRYLEAAADGGFKYVIEEQNGILDIVNPQTAPMEAIYLLYKQYGLEVFPGIPEDFLRAFLPSLGVAWSKKGSLDVISFIASSLSGIKTNTEITYDSSGNPVVTVRFEMENSLRDYFPDHKQFERILKNFVPFYCDSIIIYTYEYFEELLLMVGGQEYLHELITEKVSENCTIPLDIEEHLDLVTHRFEELGNLQSSESGSYDRVIPELEEESQDVSFSEQAGIECLTEIVGESQSMMCSVTLNTSINEIGEDIANITSPEQGVVDKVMKKAVLNVGTLNSTFVLNKTWTVVESITE